MRQHSARAMLTPAKGYRKLISRRLGGSALKSLSR
jgi:hypothetical protein